MGEQSEERVFLTYEEAVAMLPDGEYIHTFRQTTTGEFMGADWSMSELLVVMKGNRVELSGELATSMGHGLVLNDEVGLLFIETKKRWVAGDDLLKKAAGEIYRRPEMCISAILKYIIATARGYGGRMTRTEIEITRGDYSTEPTHIYARFFKRVCTQLQNVRVYAIVYTEHHDVKLSVRVEVEVNGETYKVEKTAREIDYPPEKWDWKMEADSVVEAIFAALLHEIFVDKETYREIWDEYDKEYRADRERAALKEEE